MVRDVRIERSSAVIAWTDGHQVTVPLLWLRDHCPCSKCLHPETRQRLSDTVAFDAALSVSRIAIAAQAADLEIEWSGADAHVSRFDAAWLRSATRLTPPTAPGLFLWDEARLAGNPVPHVAYEALMAPGDAGDRVLKDWLEQIERFGFAFVEGTPATPEATQAVARRAAYIR